MVNASEKLLIFGRYIGQRVLVKSYLNNEVQIGTLKGVKQNGVLININEVSRWIPVSDKLELCDIKLLLKPLKNLTPEIISTANGLPVQAFITPYYQQLGFDMPVYIAPGHPCNCNYVQEIGLADYRSARELTTAN
ncbi:hypothetical protein [Mucilaginibacter segetis]|uniref:Uncharacterized protein n=1 Tax=Mucilaginibacter segetis TaxID=2793071 RepID=A0A934PNC3_9SPHI|nr:hypothetical protein [Mucilaginibacter segetis]MBK0377734.1 hypothetical protein [Mucilaginibacter segetis]